MNENHVLMMILLLCLVLLLLSSTGIYFADSFSKSYGYCRDFQGSFGFVGGQLQQQQQFGGWGRRNNNSNNDDSAAERSKCLLLCEVALGNPFQAHQYEYMESCKPGTDSTQAVSSKIPDPLKSVYTPEGLYIPNGPMVNVKQPTDWRPSPPPAAQQFFATSESEFVVYNEGQARMRYLIQVGEPRKKYTDRLNKFAQRKAIRAREEEKERNRTNVD